MQGYRKGSRVKNVGSYEYCENDFISIVESEVNRDFPGFKYNIGI